LTGGNFCVVIILLVLHRDVGTSSVTDSYATTSFVAVLGTILTFLTCLVAGLYAVAISVYVSSFISVVCFGSSVLKASKVVTVLVAGTRRVLVR